MMSNGLSRSTQERARRRTIYELLGNRLKAVTLRIILTDAKSLLGAQGV